MASSTVPAIGQQLSIQAGKVQVWGLVDDAQTANWVDTGGGQTAAWAGVNTTQNPNWQEVA
jgi:hypothetical protein